MNTAEFNKYLGWNVHFSGFFSLDRQEFITFLTNIGWPI